MSTVVIMAGGTGGHIYPALAVGTELRARGVNVYWMGVRSGLEDQLARTAGIEFDAIRVKGLWGKGLMRWMTLPLWISISLWQSVGIILNRRPDLMLGMGGYVCGPGGMAAAMLRRPLIIHESNAIAGLTNRILAFMAMRVLSGVEKSDLGQKAVFTGTPVRAEILAAAKHKPAFEGNHGQPLNLLIIGGSQGAEALNQALPKAFAEQPADLRPNIKHQTGPGRTDKVRAAYQTQGIEAEVVDYISDMAQAYSWADIVVARAGAMTIAELSAMGLAVVLVPLPHAARDHQRANAEVLMRLGAAIVCLQNNDFESKLRTELMHLISNRERVRELAERIRANGRPDATNVVVEYCMEALET